MINTKELLQNGIAELGLEITGHQIDSFITYLQELMRWNKAHNLTGLKTERDIIIKHFLDSLLFAKVLPEQTTSVIDIGSGAGFPGIPLSIMNPDQEVFLVEPKKKKAIFLRHMVHHLGLKKTEVMDKRVEDISGVQVDAALTRALFSINEFVVKVAALLKNQGVFILSKGPNVKAELENSALRGIIIRNFQLPFIHDVRYLIIIPKANI